MIKILMYLLLPLPVYASGSVIGNGGDPIFYFLEATRSSLSETIRGLQVSENAREKFCTEGLSKNQSDHCRSFFFAIAAEMLKLNNGKDKTLFVLRKKPLRVIGPDGAKMPVAARTKSGPKGVIEFHRDSIQFLAPSDILFLMTHEFGHKAAFENRYVSDNEPVEGFANGRELIDTMAHALVKAAKTLNKVGTAYGLRDNFECVIRTANQSFGQRSSSARLFSDSTRMSYETSLSRWPTDPGIFLPESDRSELTYRMVITEPSNCDDSRTEGRKTELTIVRRFLAPIEREEEVLASSSLPSFNPICDKSRPPMELSYGNATFSCKYFGTQGTTALSSFKAARSTRSTASGSRE
jgi:hypothetical protein